MVKKKKEIKDEDEKIINELEKKYGMGKPSVKDLQIVSTGSLQLNKAMKIGGTPLGKIIEIYGPESSGKSTIMLHQIAEYQQAYPDKRAALFDYEYSFDPKYAAAIGVDLDKLLLYQPEDQESGYDMIVEMTKRRLLSCAILDSQTAAMPKAVLAGEMGDSTIALQARNNSKFCGKIKGLLSLNNATLFIISQTRDKIGSMGEPTGTTGGNAIKFYADIRWKVWKFNDKVNELNKTTIDVIKSKVGKPFGKAEVNILWGVGFDTVGEILNYACEFGIVKRAGSWYSYDGSQLGQGAEKIKEILLDNPELYDEIKEQVMAVLYPPVEIEETIAE